MTEHCPYLEVRNTSQKILLLIDLRCLDGHEQAIEFGLGGIPKVFGSSATDFV